MGARSMSRSTATRKPGPPRDGEENGATKGPSWFRRVEEQLRRAADEAPAAFFDFHQAMGGQGSMARFQQHHMTQGDYLHLNAKGGAYVGDRIVAALARPLRAGEARYELRSGPGPALLASLPPAAP